MKGNRFEGLSDNQWQVLGMFLPTEPEKRKKVSLILPGERFAIVFYGF
jgi:hypothetical protein